MGYQLMANARETTKAGGDRECRGGSELLFLVGLSRDGFPETVRLEQRALRDSGLVVEPC